MTDGSQPQNAPAAHAHVVQRSHIEIVSSRNSTRRWERMSRIYGATSNVHPVPMGVAQIAVQLSLSFHLTFLSCPSIIFLSDGSQKKREPRWEKGQWGCRASFSLDFTWCAVHLAVHSPEYLHPDPRQPGHIVFSFGWRWRDSSCDDHEDHQGLRGNEASWEIAESSPSEWLFFRRRFQATGGLPKAEISGLHLEKTNRTDKIELPTVSPQCACCQLAMLVELVHDQSESVHLIAGKLGPLAPSTTPSFLHGDRHSLKAGVPSNISRADSRLQLGDFNSLPLLNIN